MKKTKRCSKCWKAVTPDDCVDWEWEPQWFALGAGMLKAVLAINKKNGKTPKPRKRTYHRIYGQRERWEARGKPILCGEIRDSHPDEDRFEFFMSLLPNYREYPEVRLREARPSRGLGRLA